MDVEVNVAGFGFRDDIGRRTGAYHFNGRGECAELEVFDEVFIADNLAPFCRDIRAVEGVTRKDNSILARARGDGVGTTSAFNAVIARAGEDLVSLVGAKNGLARLASNHRAGHKLEVLRIEVGERVNRVLTAEVRLAGHNFQIGTRVGQIG